MFEFLSRLNPEPDPAVVAERPQRMHERWLFRTAISATVSRAGRWR